MTDTLDDALAAGQAAKAGSRCACGCGGVPATIGARWLRGHHRAAHPLAGVDLYRVEDRGYATPCWTWQAYVSPDGYGYRIPAKHGTRIAHRIAYIDAYGPIPTGLQVDHLCRNRACVNPDHLEAVTIRENLLRGDTLAAANARKTHCPHGHPYDEENTGHSRTGGRYCRECRRVLARKYYWQRKEAA